MADNLITLGQIDASDTLGTTLHHAAQTGNKKALKKVLEKGIDVDYPNDEGQSALFCACLACKENAVEVLLEAGANPNEKDNHGLTPVHVACYAADVHFLIKLLNHGADLRLHDHQGRGVKDWAMLHEVPKKRMKILEFLDKTRLFAMSHSGQDLLLHRASSHTLNRAHQRQNSITKVIRDRIGRPSVHQNLEGMAMSQHSVGFGQVYSNSRERSGFLSAIPLVGENNLRHDKHGETYNNGAFFIMESMWWEYTQVTVKKLHKDVDPYHGGVVDLLINEVEQIGKLRHPNILTLMGVCQTSNLDGLILIYERIEKGSLYNYLHQKIWNTWFKFALTQMERLPSQTIQDIAVQMCNAIIFIHLRGLVHCGITLYAISVINGNTFKLSKFNMERLTSQTIKDIAVQMCNAIIFIHLRGLVHCGITSHAINVINDNTFKLSNFQYMVELSKCELGKKNSINTNTEENSVYNWMAPEIMFNFPPSFYCDMYSYCAVLWEIFHGGVPFDKKCAESIKSFHQKGNMIQISNGKMTDYHKIILEYGLQHDPNNRKLSFLHVKDLLLTAPKDINQYVRAHFQHLQQNDNASCSQQRAPRHQLSAPPGIQPAPRSRHISGNQADNVASGSPFSKGPSNLDDDYILQSPVRRTSNRDDDSTTRSPFYQSTSNQVDDFRTNTPKRDKEYSSRSQSPFHRTQQDEYDMTENPFRQSTSNQIDNEISSRTERSKYNDGLATNDDYQYELLKKDKHKSKRDKKEKAVKERQPDAYVEDSEEDYEYDRTRQVRNRSNNSSHSSFPRFGWVGKQFVPMYRTTPKKPARSSFHYNTDRLQWECTADTEGDRYNYTVTVENTKEPSPVEKQPRESRQSIEGKPPVHSRQRSASRSPTKSTQTRESWQPVEARQPGDAQKPEAISKESDSGTTTGSADDSSKYAKGTPLARKTSSMGRFSYLNLQNLQKSRVAGAKPACHEHNEYVAEEYSTLGKLTTAGSLYALYNEHSPDLPLGQPEYRYSPEKHYPFTMPRPKLPPPPMKSPDKAWFGGRGSVRDLAKCFQEQIMEHDYNQRLLDGKLNNNCSSDGRQQLRDELQQELRQSYCPDKSIYSKPSPGEMCNRTADDIDNLHSSACSLTTVSDAGSDSFDPYKITYDLGDDSSSAFTSIDSNTRLNSKGEVDSSTDSDIVSKWVDHEIRKIGRKLSRDMMTNQSQAQLPVVSPDLFDISENQQGPRQGHDATSSSSDHNARAAAHEAGDQDHYIPDRHTFYDDEIYRSPYCSPSKSPQKSVQSPSKSARKNARRMSGVAQKEDRYLDDHSRSPYKSSLPMESFLSKPEDEDVENLNACQDAAENPRRQRSRSRGRVPTCKFKLPIEPEGAFANIVTVKSSLDNCGVHSIKHEMHNLKTGDKKTIATDTVTANKVVTTFKGPA